MSVKQAAKRLLPEGAIEAIRYAKHREIERKHSRMSQKEVESWLEGMYERAVCAKLHLDDPQRYTEKIQWCKLHAMDETKSLLADKYAVRSWVEERIGKQCLVPLLGVWDDPNDIDFNVLPDSFVLKTNNAWNTNIIVGDKSQFDERRARRQLKRWLKQDFGWESFEPQYLRIPPKDRLIERPSALDETLSLARALSKGFAHVRVDFYIVDGRPLFGEMTFSHKSGFTKFEPSDWDYKLGDMWDLSKERKAPIALRG